ncbi:MAG: hypothetical protein IKJ39_04570 [Lachnospiraceae bacterium]|nr:hypothetical protein [Lachnospiraceae bacterium]
MKQTIIKYILFIPLLVFFCLCGTACVFIVGNLFSAPIEVWSDGFKSGVWAWLLILAYTVWKDITKRKQI